VDAAFFLLVTSGSQRKLIMAVAEAAYPPDEHQRPHPLKKRIGQLNARTDTLAADRNAAIHAELLVAYTDHTKKERTLAVAPGSNTKKRNSFAGTNVEQELQRTVREIAALISDLEGFLDTIAPKLELPPALAEALARLGSQEIS
jgi:hypothetical protein